MRSKTTVFHSNPRSAPLRFSKRKGGKFMIFHLFPLKIQSSRPKSLLKTGIASARKKMYSNL